MRIGQCREALSSADQDKHSLEVSPRLAFLDKSSGRTEGQMTGCVDPKPAGSDFNVVANFLEQMDRH
jgi:hypothetical protein